MRPGLWAEKQKAGVSKNPGLCYLRLKLEIYPTNEYGLVAVVANEHAFIEEVVDVIFEIVIEVVDEEVVVVEALVVIAEGVAVAAKVVRHRGGGYHNQHGHSGDYRKKQLDTSHREISFTK
jgi:formylmethanofuran:tetrahydromethanopterin formyltransferase